MSNKTCYKFFFFNKLRIINYKKAKKNNWIEILTRANNKKKKHIKQLDSNSS